MNESDYIPMVLVIDPSQMEAMNKDHDVILISFNGQKYAIMNAKTFIKNVAPPSS